MSLKKNFQVIRKAIPNRILVIAAGKTKTKKEILEFINAGGTDVGYNYVQEAEKIHKELGKDSKKLTWHMIGKLQKNKINKALLLFSMIQTIDSFKIAHEIDKKSKHDIDVLIQINIGNEPQKNGLKAEYNTIINEIKNISSLKHIKVKGLMTMAPFCSSKDGYRPYFKKMKLFFEKIKKQAMPNVEMKYLSMGMSNSYSIAIEEGANMIRLGTILFGERRLSGEKR